MRCYALAHLATVLLDSRFICKHCVIINTLQHEYNVLATHKHKHKQNRADCQLHCIAFVWRLHQFPFLSSSYVAVLFSIELEKFIVSHSHITPSKHGQASASWRNRKMVRVVGPMISHASKSTHSILDNIDDDGTTFAAALVHSCTSVYASIWSYIRVCMITRTIYSCIVCVRFGYRFKSG